MNTAKRNRPYIICHMVTSIDGKVTGDFLNTECGGAAVEMYYEINRTLKGDAFACGRITMESSFTNGFRPDVSVFQGITIPYEDHIAQTHDYYAVSFDRHGSVGWQESKIHDADPGYDDCHIIEVLTEDTPQAMLAYYRSMGVSYIFAGRNDIDLTLALHKLYTLFGIERLLLEGGSEINGAFQRAQLIDEFSIVMAPMLASAEDKPLCNAGIMAHYSLAHMQPMANDTIWLRYQRKTNT